MALKNCITWDQGSGVMKRMMLVDDMIVNAKKIMGGKIWWDYFYQNREKKEYIDPSKCVRKMPVDKKVEWKGEALT